MVLGCMSGQLSQTVTDLRTEPAVELVISHNWAAAATAVAVVVVVAAAAARAKPVFRGQICRVEPEVVRG